MQNSIKNFASSTPSASPLSSKDTDQRSRHLCLCSAILTIIFILSPRVANAETAAVILTAEQLSGTIQQPNVVLLDIREKEEYTKEHIVGARWVDINAWRAKTHEPNGLNEKTFWSTALGELGVSQDKTLIIIGGAVPESARVWWLLRYLGMKNVQLLDGGHKAWIAAGLPTASTDQESQVINNTEPVIEFQENLLARLEDVTPEAMAATNCKIIDNRSEGEFTGSRGIGVRTGHIPNATHLEWQNFVDENGKFLSAESIREKLVEAGVDVHSPLVTHCQSGGRSSVAALALELAGAKNVKNFYGGWAQYGDAVTLPVAKTASEKSEQEKASK